MSEQPVMKLTDFDFLTSDSHLQMMKAAMPYIGGHEQKMISILVKCQELKRTVELFDSEEAATVGICSLDESEPRSSYDMLMAMKPYGSAQEQDFIDMVCNLIQGIRLGNQYQEMQAPREISPGPGNNYGGSTAGQDHSGPSPLRRSNLDQLRSFLSPEMQSRMETASLLMQTMQQMT